MRKPSMKLIHNLERARNKLKEASAILIDLESDLDDKGFSNTRSIILNKIFENRRVLVKLQGELVKKRSDMIKNQQKKGAIK